MNRAAGTGKTAAGVLRFGETLLARMRVGTALLRTLISRDSRARAAIEENARKYSHTFTFDWPSATAASESSHRSPHETGSGARHRDAGPLTTCGGLYASTRRDPRADEAIACRHRISPAIRQIVANSEGSQTLLFFATLSKEIEH